MIEVALSATRNKNTRLRDFYQRIKARHGHKKAVVALGRKMLCIAWHLLRNNELFDEKQLKITQKKIKRLDSMARILERAGYAVTKPATGLQT